jgi:two-component system OmpR family response regulator
MWVVRRSVLIVDDDLVLAGCVQDYLGYCDYSVRVAATSREALSLLRGRPPDIVLLNIHLPDGDGLEVVRHIRRIGAKTGIIVATAFGGVQPALAAMAVGADNYVEKPVPLRCLKLMIERIIGDQLPKSAPHLN